MSIKEIDTKMQAVIQVEANLRNSTDPARERKAIKELQDVLTSLVGDLTEEAKSKEGAATSQAPESGRGMSDYEKNVIALSVAISRMQVISSEILLAKGQADMGVTAAQLKALEANIKVVTDQIQNMIDKQKNASIWQKIAAALSILIGGILCLLGQPQIGVVMIVMGLLQVTGLMDKMMDALKTAIQKANPTLSSGMAKLIADIIITAIVTVVGMGVGGLTAGVQNAANTAAREMVSLGSRLLSGFITGVTQGALTTNLAADLVTTLPISNERTKKILQAVATAAVVILSMAAPVGSSLGAIANASTSAVKVLGAASTAANAANGVANGVAGYYTLHSGIIQYNLAVQQAVSLLLEHNVPMMENIQKSTQKFSMANQEFFKEVFELLGRMAPDTQYLARA